MGPRPRLAELEERGWVEHFDLEGDFHLDGAHAALARRLVGRAGVADATFREGRTEHGLFLAGATAQVRSAFFIETDRRSDWCEPDVVLAVVRRLVAPVGYDVGTATATDPDQTVRVIVFPTRTPGVARLLEPERARNPGLRELAWEELDALGRQAAEAERALEARAALARQDAARRAQAAAAQASAAAAAVEVAKTASGEALIAALEIIARGNRVTALVELDFDALCERADREAVEYVRDHLLRARDGVPLHEASRRRAR